MAVKVTFKLNWAPMMRQLEAFRKAHGHIRLDDCWNRYPELAGWLIGVRRELETLSYQQVLSLDRLGFFDMRDRRWLASYARLRIFQETFGHCDVPARWPKNPTLSVWVHWHRGKRVVIPWRRKLLDELGFRFRLVAKGPVLRWEEGIERLKRYRERFGDCNVPARWSEDIAFGVWISGLRGKKMRSLNRDKIKQLDDLGFDWHPIRSAWEQRFQELKAFVEKHGHCRVPDKSDSLGIWVANVRHNKHRHSQARAQQRKARSKMPIERRKLLDDLGFVWGMHGRR